jgi:hypothetical protein
MKKLKIISIIILSLISTFLLVNCEKENVVIEEQALTPELIGKLHNKALDNIFKNEKNFDFDTTEKGLRTQIINSNNNFLSNKLKEFNVIQLKENNFDKDIEHLNTESLVSKNFKESTLSKKTSKFSLSESNVFDKIDFLFNSGVILQEDKETLDKLYLAYKKHCNNEITDNELKNISDELKIIYATKNSDYSKDNVLITLSILEICSNSLDWFSENEAKINFNIKSKSQVPIASIIAADAVGAIMGIAEAIVVSAVIDGTNKPVSGKAVIVGAVVSAATSSIGAGIKILSWLAKLVK